MPPPPAGPPTNLWLGEPPVREARESRSECQLAVPWRRHSPQTHTDGVTQARTASPLAACLSTARPVILRLKEFAVDYVFWAEAGGFGDKRPGHFEDLPSSSCGLPGAVGSAWMPTCTHAHTETRRAIKRFRGLGSMPQFGTPK